MEEDRNHISETKNNSRLWGEVVKNRYLYPVCLAMVCVASGWITFTAASSRISLELVFSLFMISYGVWLIFRQWAEHSFRKRIYSEKVRERREIERRAFYGSDPVDSDRLDTDSGMDLSGERPSPLEESVGSIPKTHGSKNNAALFDLYNNQLTSYQDETKARASRSFTYAIIAMAVGLGFLGAGMYYLFEKAETISDFAGGSIISVLGASFSAYITKTFLEVHKYSLGQLNRYCQQPLISEMILTAQRIGDRVEDKDGKDDAHLAIINTLLGIVSRIESGTELGLQGEGKLKPKAAAKDGDSTAASAGGASA